MTVGGVGAHTCWRGSGPPRASAPAGISHDTVPVLSLGCTLERSFGKFSRGASLAGTLLDTSVRALLKEQPRPRVQHAGTPATTPQASPRRRVSRRRGHDPPRHAAHVMKGGSDRKKNNTVEADEHDSPADSKQGSRISVQDARPAQQAAGRGRGLHLTYTRCAPLCRALGRHSLPTSSAPPPALSSTLACPGQLGRLDPQAPPCGWLSRQPSVGVPHPP